MKQKHWDKWDVENHYLAFLMRNGTECSYVILNPQEAKYLLDSSKNAADMSKKIDIRVSAKGRIYIIQWKDLDIAHRIQKLSHYSISDEETDRPRSQRESTNVQTWNPKAIVTKRSSWQDNSHTRPRSDLINEIEEIQTKIPPFSNIGSLDLRSPADLSGAPPRTSGKSKDITNLVERSFEIETALHLGIYGIYAKEDPEGQITLNGEVRADSGRALPKDLILVITFHDNLGRIPHVEEVDFNSSSPLGSHVFSVQWVLPPDIAQGSLAKIRIQPGVRSGGSVEPARKGLLSKLFGWIR
ncbi:MAG: hypothetical protein ACP5M0_13860 [Desulfomonilaceae bacterium]